MRTPVLVAVVVAVHAVAIGSVMFIQGCGTKKPVMVEPPPAPVMPPKQETQKAPEFKPVFHPPVAVEPAPAMEVPSEAKTYVVQNGDSLSKIASRCGVSSREISALNNIKDPNKIRVGQKLVLPDYATGKSMVSAPSKPKAKAKQKASAPAKAESVSAAGGSTYVVQSGDSLSKIASKQGVKISSLRAANPKIKGDKILVGQKLVIPGAAAAPVAAPAVPVPAPVPAPALESMPPMQDPITPSSIQPAPAIPAPAPSMPAVVAPAPVPVSQGQPLDYTVQDGDTLDSIAKLFIVRKEDLMAMNGVSDSTALKPGMKLKIPSTP